MSSIDKAQCYCERSFAEPIKPFDNATSGLFLGPTYVTNGVQCKQKEREIAMKGLTAILHLGIPTRPESMHNAGENLDVVSSFDLC